MINQKEPDKVINGNIIQVTTTITENFYVPSFNHRITKDLTEPHYSLGISHKQETKLIGCRNFIPKDMPVFKVIDKFFSRFKLP